jgi:hypothetical protein
MWTPKGLENPTSMAVTAHTAILLRLALLTVCILPQQVFHLPSNCFLPRISNAASLIWLQASSSEEAGREANIAPYHLVSQIFLRNFGGSVYGPITFVSLHTFKVSIM